MHWVWSILIVYVVLSYIAGAYSLRRSTQNKNMNHAEIVDYGFCFLLAPLWAWIDIVEIVFLKLGNWVCDKGN